MYPNVPWPILASFSNLVAASQNGKLYSSKYFSRSRAMFICNRFGDGVDGGVRTPFKFVMAAVLKSVVETSGVEKQQHAVLATVEDRGRSSRERLHDDTCETKKKKNSGRSTLSNDLLRRPNGREYLCTYLNRKTWWTFLRILKGFRSIGIATVSLLEKHEITREEHYQILSKVIQCDQRHGTAHDNSSGKSVRNVI